MLLVQLRAADSAHRPSGRAGSAQAFPTEALGLTLCRSLGLILRFTAQTRKSAP